MSKQLIDIITKTSFQVIKSAGFTKKDEFIDVNEKKIPEGIPYHIHRTRDKREYYMTSAQHETTSILIFKKNNKTDFFRYKTLTNRKSQLYLQENRTIPTETDYEKGFINLYFARQANDKKSKVFQINENDYKQDTPFYEKITLRLKITGNEDNVFAENNSVIEAQDVFYPGLSLVISPLSYYQESRFSTSSPSSTSGGSSGGGGGGY